MDCRRVGMLGAEPTECNPWALRRDVVSVGALPVGRVLELFWFDSWDLDG